MAKLLNAPKIVTTVGSPEVRMWRWPGEPNGHQCPPPPELFNRYSEMEWYHKPITEEQVKQINQKWAPIWCGGYDLDAAGKKVYHHFARKACFCKPGPQYIAPWCPAREIACAGGRGSSKTELMIAWLAQGNPYMDPSDPYCATYLNSPDYKFLVLRKNSKDLKDFFERAKKFFAWFGAAATESPSMGFRFPSGAWGVLDHVADGEAYEKYMGQEFTRISWEECTQCPDEERYMRIVMSLRSSDERLTEQIMLTANPGGPGQRWFRKRFWKMVNSDGSEVKPGQIYTEPETGRTRCLIFSTVEDNPYQMRKGYDKSLDQLAATDPTLHRQWRYGDFDIVKGQYFEAFRPKRLPHEPENAVHVVKPIKLAEWWPRAIGVDWGYGHSSGIVWGCWSSRRQLHIYREYKVSRMSTVQLGAEIAKKSIVDLEGMPSHHMNLYLSFDSFHREDDISSEAEQIGRGIGEVLGHDAAFVFWFTPEERELPDDRAWDSLMRRQKELSGRTNITLIRANNARKAGWQLIRDQLRWIPLHPKEDYDEQQAKELLLSKGVMAWSEYKKRCEDPEEMTLPVLQIWETCPEVIAGIESAVEDEDRDKDDVLKQDGDDPIDALRHLIIMFPFSEGNMPRNAFLGDRLRRLREENPGISAHSMMMSSAIFADEYNRSHGGGRAFSIPRRAGPTARRNAASYAP